MPVALALQREILKSPSPPTSGAGSSSTRTWSSVSGSTGSGRAADDGGVPDEIPPSSPLGMPPGPLATVSRADALRAQLARSAGRSSTAPTGSTVRRGLIGWPGSAARGASAADEQIAGALRTDR